MIATTAMLGVGCIGLMGAMKYQNVKTEASDIKESEVAKVGVDVSSGSVEGETPLFFLSMHGWSLSISSVLPPNTKNHIIARHIIIRYVLNVVE